MTVYSSVFESITLDGARVLRDAALELAQKREIAIAIAVINPQGILVLAETMDGSAPGSAEAALMKARGAARYRIATHLTAEFIKTLPANLAHHALGLPDLCAFQGGLPVKLGDSTIGGLGIAGGSGAQDIELASAAVLELAARCVG